MIDKKEVYLIFFYGIFITALLHLLLNWLIQPLTLLILNGIYGILLIIAHYQDKRKKRIPNECSKCGKEMDYYLSVNGKTLCYKCGLAKSYLMKEAE